MASKQNNSFRGIDIALPLQDADSPSNTVLLHISLSFKHVAQTIQTLFTVFMTNTTVQLGFRHKRVGVYSWHNLYCLLASFVYVAKRVTVPCSNSPRFAAELRAEPSPSSPKHNTNLQESTHQSFIKPYSTRAKLLRIFMRCLTPVSAFLNAFSNHS